jgi:predicted nucleotidyltransferase
MNLHINKTEFDFLMSCPNFGKFEVGSKLYGLNDKESDTDYYIIMYPYKNLLINPFSNHNKFQYKDIENNIDYNFIDVITFINNLVKGDCTISFELLFTDSFQQSPLVFLSDLRYEFYTYNIIKSYLGLVDRDIRHLSKKKGRDLVSGMLHITRGYEFAKQLTKFHDLVLVDKELIKYKKILTEADNFRNSFIQNLSTKREEIKEFRAKFNTLYEKGKFVRYLKPNIQNQIQKDLSFYVYHIENLVELTESLLMKIYNSNEEINIKY